MCSYCFNKEYKGFPSHDDFERFEKDLDLKLRENKVEIYVPTGEGVIDYELNYICKICNEKFVMSVPDNAWRGYFLKEENALKYLDDLKQSDRKTRNGCLVMLLVILLISLLTLFIQF